MKNIKFLLILAALFSFAACEDEPNGENGENANANYWYRHGFVTGGIKSVTEYSFTETFDEKGRPTGSYSENQKSTITYGDNGLPSKIVDEYTGSDEVKEVKTTTYEYKNDMNTFFPRPFSTGMFFHLDHAGLVPGLSKVTWVTKVGDKEDAPIVSVFTLSGNKLTIHTDGEFFGEPFDDVEFEYKDGYPLSTKDDREFLGPFTYQKDGRFDQYIEGFTDEETGDITMKRTRTYSKSFKYAMLPEKEVSLYYNVGESTPWDTETITFKYDDKGNLLEETSTHTAEYSETGKTTYEYKFDSKGNWTECTGTHVVVGKPEIEPNTWTRTRTIEYYK